MIPPLHLVTDDTVLARRDFLAVVHEVLEAGGRDVALHVRGPGATGALLFERSRSVLGAVRAAGASLFVNDRVDIALTLEVDGVQLGRRSLPLPLARALLPRHQAIGVSIHALEEAADADEGGADFLVLGTIFETASHPGRPGAGPALVEAVARSSRLPLVVIGGVTPERVRRLTGAGIQGVATIRGIWDAESPGGAVEAYLSALGGSGRGGERRKKGRGRDSIDR